MIFEALPPSGGGSRFLLIVGIVCGFLSGRARIGFQTDPLFENWPGWVWFELCPGRAMKHWLSSGALNANSIGTATIGIGHVAEQKKIKQFGPFLFLQDGSTGCFLSCQQTDPI